MVFGRRLVDPASCRWPGFSLAVSVVRLGRTVAWVVAAGFPESEPIDTEYEEITTHAATHEAS